jgi:hypothetical protein
MASQLPLMIVPHDLIASRQPHTGAKANGLSGIKGIKNMSLGIGAHPNAIVSNSDSDLVYGYLLSLNGDATGIIR